MKKTKSMISQYVIYSTTDLKGIITKVSDAFCNISGYSKKELLGQPHSMVRHPDMPSSAFKDMWDTIQKGKTWKGEVKNLKKNGDYYWVLANISPQFDKENNLIGYMAVRQDITDKKNFMEQHKKLVQAEKMSSLGDMIVNIAHQWRQPLSVISTLVTSMQMQKEYGMLNDEKFNESCEKINSNVQNLSKTINDFQSYVEDTKVIENFTAKELVDKFLNITQSAIDRNKIQVILNIDENLRIDSLQNKLLECFISMFNNSKYILKTLDESKRYIFITIQKINNNIIIKFKDTAGGISSDIIDKIYEPYFTTKHQSQGTGLGLHMTYDMIVNVLEGDITANNVEFKYNHKNFKGVKFTINLPIKSHL